MKSSINPLILSILLVGCAHSVQSKQNIKILPVSKVDWQKLNAARGDKSPQAGTLWGDRKGKQATGFLAKFVDGFSSPAHIHNVSYRAIVIEGLIHNDDASAETMWMPKGSYWTQPAGEPHITSAKGKTNIALVEIDHGPYLVKSIQKKFDNGERPYNIHASNIIWKNKEKYKQIDLWQNKQGKITGSLIKFEGKIDLELTQAKLVVIGGELEAQDQILAEGSLISVKNTAEIAPSCQVKECILYLKK